MWFLVCSCVALWALRILIDCLIDCMLRAAYSAVQGRAACARYNKKKLHTHTGVLRSKIMLRECSLACSMVCVRSRVAGRAFQDKKNGRACYSHC